MYKNKITTKNVYWSVFASSLDWPKKRIVQNSPELLFRNKLGFDATLNNAEHDYYEQTISRCPAHQQSKNNVYYINSPLDFYYELDEFGTISHDQPYYFYINSVRKAQYDNRFTVNLSLQYIFFSEENVTLEILPPYLHKTELQNHGVISTGEFNISRWFRPINFEFLLWENEKNLRIKENEPMVYLKFHSDSKIILKEFKCTDTIFSQAHACAQHHHIYKPKQTLESRYKKFDQSNLKKVILKEIKNNII